MNVLSHSISSRENKYQQESSVEEHLTRGLDSSDPAAIDLTWLNQTCSHPGKQACETTWSVQTSVCCWDKSKDAELTAWATCQVEGFQSAERLKMLRFRGLIQCPQCTLYVVSQQCQGKLKILLDLLAWCVTRLSYCCQQKYLLRGSDGNLLWVEREKAD